MKVTPTASAAPSGSWSSRSARMVPPMAEINVIPLVDVTLVLLIIFMVTTAFVKAPGQPQGNAEIPVTLPVSAVSAASVAGPADLVLGVDTDGQRYVGGQAVTADEMIEQVKTAAAQNPNRHVRIDADQNAPFQHVVELMEICEFEGLRNVGVHVRDQQQVH
jgi:biopolymer transport protein ExbD